MWLSGIYFGRVVFLCSLILKIKETICLIKESADFMLGRCPVLFYRLSLLLSHVTRQQCLVKTLQELMA